MLIWLVTNYGSLLPLRNWHIFDQKLSDKTWNKSSNHWRSNHHKTWASKGICRSLQGLKYTEIIAYRCHFEVIIETSFFFQLRLTRLARLDWLNITFWGVFPCYVENSVWSYGDPIGTCVHTCNIFGRPGFSGGSEREIAIFQCPNSSRCHDFLPRIEHPKSKGQPPSSLDKCVCPCGLISFWT